MRAIWIIIAASLTASAVVLLLGGCAQPTFPVEMYYTAELHLQQVGPDGQVSRVYSFYDTVLMPLPLARWLIEHSGLQMDKPLPEGGKGRKPDLRRNPPVPQSGKLFID